MSGKTSKVHIRVVSTQDCEDLWRWRNNEATRRYSLKQDEISFMDHRLWFEQMMSDSSKTCYIACEDVSLNKVGQIRFDAISNNMARVSVGLNPLFMGKKLGSEIIESGTALFFKDNANMTLIKAQIKSENVASIKAFKSAGYIENGREPIGENPMLLFLKERDK